MYQDMGGLQGPPGGPRGPYVCRLVLIASSWLDPLGVTKVGLADLLVT